MHKFTKWKRHWVHDVRVLKYEQEIEALFDNLELLDLDVFNESDGNMPYDEALYLAGTVGTIIPNSRDIWGVSSFPQGRFNRKYNHTYKLKLRETKQSRWRNKMRLMSRCSKCGKPADGSKGYCFHHAKKNSERKLRRNGTTIRKYNTKYGESLELIGVQVVKEECMKTLCFTLMEGDVTIQIPHPMTEESFEILLKILELQKPALVHAEAKKLM